MAKKKRKSKARKTSRKSGKKAAKARKAKLGKRKAKAGKKKAKAKPAKRKAKKRKAPVKVESILRQELEEQGKELFYPPKEWTFKSWVKRYSPVIVTLLIGLATYFYLVFYLFYPQTLLQGHYLQLLILLMFVFLIAGLLIYLGLRAELLFMRILSFIFVFVIFTFLLLFILIAYTMQSGLG
jgi:hypothetical protein